MFLDRAVPVDLRPPAGSRAVVEDLGLAAIISAMAGDDVFLSDVAVAGLLSSVTDPQVLRHRQDALADTVADVRTVERLYALATEALDALHRHMFVGWGQQLPENSLYHSSTTLRELLPILRELRTIAADRGGVFSSPAFTDLFADIVRDLAEPALVGVARCLDGLEQARDTRFAGRLGDGGAGVDYHRVELRRRSLRHRLRGASAVRFRVDPDDVEAAQELAAVEDRALRTIASTLLRSTTDLGEYFRALRWETGFYLAAARLVAALRATGSPVCRPTVRAAPGFAARDLYDPGVALCAGRRPVGNDVEVERSLIVVTGPNQGGKSTFLRSVGAAQLLMQAGLCVPAASFESAVHGGVATHFRRREDAGLTMGALDEELARMDRIVDTLAPRSLLLCNESFQTTNERAGAWIARNVLWALIEADHTVVCVTHLYELAARLHQERAAQFLRAERTPDGARTLRVVPGAPHASSNGGELFQQIFGESPDPDAAP
ncbi:DNA mismatch repair protein MutS [Tsukamurella soli]|uniref:DNA mismatch repair protein MutS n=2 Tax=Tsukamurella soli TaxID=644556 RepID=A0ABP8JLV4_9ACTN